MRKSRYRVATPPTGGTTPCSHDVNSVPNLHSYIREPWICLCGGPVVGKITDWRIGNLIKDARLFGGGTGGVGKFSLLGCYCFK